MNQHYKKASRISQAKTPSLKDTLLSHNHHLYICHVHVFSNRYIHPCVDLFTVESSVTPSIIKPPFGYYFPYFSPITKPLKKAFEINISSRAYSF